MRVVGGALPVSAKYVPSFPEAGEGMNMDGGDGAFPEAGGTVDRQRFLPIWEYLREVFFIFILFCSTSRDSQMTCIFLRYSRSLVWYRPKLAGSVLEG